MTRSSSLSRIRRLSLAAAWLAAVGIVLPFVVEPVSAWWLAVPHSSAAGGARHRGLVGQIERAIAQALAVCDKSAVGNYDSRITAVPEGGSLGICSCGSTMCWIWRTASAERSERRWITPAASSITAKSR